MTLIYIRFGGWIFKELRPGSDIGEPFYTRLRPCVGERLLDFECHPGLDSEEVSLLD